MKKLFVFFCCLFFCAPSWGKDDYTVTVPVSAEAASAPEAKDKAMSEAQRKAFLEVAGKYTSDENVAELGKMPDSQIVRFVQYVGVANEKTGGNRYMADLTVKINGQLLKDYMAENEMIKAEADKLLVIPVYKNGRQSYPLLWEDSNVWRRNWQSKGLIKFGLMQIKTIGENFRNIDALNADAALYMDSGLYEQVSSMAGSDSVYVVAAETLENGDLKVTVTGEKNKASESFTVLDDGTGDIFDKAVEKSVMYISNMERAAADAQSDSAAGVINAVYAYADMKDWLQKSKIIESLPQVEAVETKSFGGGKVNFALHYTGSEEDLWQALQENGFSRERNGSYFVIR